MALPRTPASYASYVAAPLLLINWLSSRTYVPALFLIFFLLAACAVNYGLGLSFSVTAWALELALVLPFLSAALGFKSAGYVNGRRLIRTLNLVVLITSLINLIQMGFPFQLPYIHYLPDYYNGGLGNGGAKIVTVIGFFGIAEALTRKRRMTFLDNRTLIISVLNFVVPNFILGILAGVAALTIFVRRNRVLLFAGAAVAMVVVPYVQYRAEAKNNTFSEYYGVNPKLYAFATVGKLYAEQPHTIFVGTGLGQFSSQPAIWSSPINRYISSHDLPQLPGMFAAEVHNRYLAPALLRFKSDVWAISSSANKPYAGISQLFAEFGLPFAIFLLYSLYALFWRNARGDFGRTIFLFAIGINFLDPQIDSPWFGVMMIAALEAIRRDAVRNAEVTQAAAVRESGVFAGPRQLTPADSI